MSPALDVCRSCPVREPCLSYAIEQNEHRGIWGGTTSRERKRLRRQFLASSARRAS